MALARSRASARRRRFALLVLPCLFLLGSLTAFAQGGVGSSRGLPGTNDGVHTIKGRVYFPGEPGVQRRFRVILRSADTTDETVSTDEDESPPH